MGAYLDTVVRLTAFMHHLHIVPSIYMGNGHETATNEVEQDHLYLDLKGARERLCRAQMLAPAHWRSDLQAALDHIDQAGSALCPQVWSVHDQPEYC